RALAREARDAAVVSEGPVAERPGDEVLRVIEARLLPADPAVGDAMRVQRKNERTIHWQESCFAILPGNCGVWQSPLKNNELRIEPLGGLFDRFFEALAGREGRQRLRVDLDLFAVDRAAPGARLALAWQERAEADHRDALSPGDVLHDRVEDGVHCFACCCPAEIPRLCRD